MIFIFFHFLFHVKLYSLIIKWSCVQESLAHHMGLKSDDLQFYSPTDSFSVISSCQGKGMG